MVIRALFVDGGAMSAPASTLCAMAERVVVDSEAPAIAARAAAEGLRTNVDDAPALPLSGGGVSAFDAALAALHTWGYGVHQAVTQTVSSRGERLGTASAAGFATLSEMDTANAGELGQVGETA